MSRPSTGAAHLDKVVPNWYKKVKRPVDIASYTDCIGGQISGEFGVFADKYFRDENLVVDIKSLARMGFQTRKLDAQPGEIDSLNRDWDREIEKRKVKAVKKEPAIV